MSRRAKIMVWLVVASLALISLWLSLPSLITQVVRYTLADAGLELLLLDIEHASLRSARIHRLEVRKPALADGEAVQFDLRAEGVELHYLPMQLLQARLQEIDIASMKLLLGSGGDEQATDDAAPATVSMEMVSQWLSMLPARQLQVRRLEVGWLAAGEKAAGYGISGAVEYRYPRLEGRFLLAEGNKELLAVSGRVDGSELELALYSPHAREQAAAELRAQLRAEEGKLLLTGQLSVKLEQGLSLWNQWTGVQQESLRATGTARVSWNMELPEEIPLRVDWRIASALQAELELQADVVQGPEREAGVVLALELEQRTDSANRIHWQVKDTTRILLRDPGLAGAGAQAGKGAAAVIAMRPAGLRGNLVAGQAGLHVELDKDSAVALELSGIPDLDLSRLELSLPQGVVLEYGEERFQSSPFALQLGQVVASYQGDKIEIGSGSVAVNKALWQAHKWELLGQVRLADVSAMTAERRLPAGNIKADVGLSDEQINAKLQLDIARSAIRAQATVTHHLDRHAGTAQITLAPALFAKGGFVLSSLLQPWSYPFDLHAGTVSGEAQLQWSRPAAGWRLQQAFRVQMEQLGGVINKYDFSGLTAQVALKGEKGLRTEKPVRIALAHINPGVEIGPVELLLEVQPGGTPDKPLLYIRELKAGVLGGEASGKDIRLDLSREEHDFELRLQGLDVARLLELQHQQGLAGTGVVDATLPVRLSSAGVAIRAGRMEARAPGGVIRYQPGEGSKALALPDPNIKLVMQALSNFHYEMLLSDVNYLPAGDLVLGVKLRGRNPDMAASRPIHLNLNVEQNVLKLLKSLRMADDLADKISERVYERQLNRK